MSDTEESQASSGVMVDITDVATEPALVEETTTTKPDTDPQAVNIVSIGTADDAYAFTFHSNKLKEILNRVPPQAKVSVVSVVGAFRTGKSFLLSWFLRYLHASQKEEQKETTAPWYEQVETLGNKGFHWKAGSERDTTGIWMWSHPHVLERENKDPLAILLVDTQGMFDHETTMSLTASIFGLSTLLSSYQVYNVDKRIQEDDLQQLALFSEFAKVAIENDGQEENADHKEEEATDTPKPFQRIEFLVRDWEHFDDHDDEDEEEDPPNFERMETMMNEYLEKVIAARDAKDLQDTREQIVSCFEQITCYGFSHPGFAVTKKKFEGDVEQIDKLFLQLLDRFCRRVFDVENLEPKKIHGRQLTALELGSYVHAYADLFASGAKFPTAATLLEATTTANNTNAVQLAVSAYKEDMDRVAGPNCNYYMKPEDLKEENEKIRKRSLELFQSVANFGSKKMIDESKKNMLREIDASWEIYTSLNEGRNPLAGLETYFVPISVGALSYVLRWFTDLTCAPYSSICKASSELFSHTSWVVFFFLFFVAATRYKQIKDRLVRLKAALEVMNKNSTAGAQKKND